MIPLQRPCRYFFIKNRPEIGLVEFSERLCETDSQLELECVMSMCDNLS